MAPVNAREQRYKDMVIEVFDAALAYSTDDPKFIATQDPVTRKFSISNPAGEALDAAIRNCLNHRSIGYFIELIQVNHESAKQAARAIKMHTENHAMKAEVFQWLDANMANFKSMDEAAGAIAKTVAPIAFRTARSWVSQWKKLRSTGTP